MQFFIVLLFLGLFAHDAITVSSRDPAMQNLGAGVSVMWTWVALLAPKLLIGALYHLLCRRAVRKMAGGTGGTGGKAITTLRRLDKFAGFIKPFLIASFFVDLFALGALRKLRIVLTDLVLIDELILLLPTLIVSAWTWMAYYRVDVTMRQASFMSRLERGEPAFIWTRWQYLLNQIRHQWVLSGAPLLLITGWFEAAQMVLDRRAPEWVIALTMLGGAITIFYFTPTIVRTLWDTTPLPPGELRDRLLTMCKEYRVGVRELLLWRTYGTMMNGAVMGLLAPQRYILLTDGLLEAMTADQVEAVMAHELAHVRKRHMFWLAMTAGGSMELLRQLAELGIKGSLHAADGATAMLPASMASVVTHPDLPQIASMVISMASWYVIFGWVSRRFERQADTVAVQHFSRQWHEQQSAMTHDEKATAATTAATPPPLPSVEQILSSLETGTPLPARAASAPVGPGRIPGSAAEVMANALQRVADLNYIPVQRHNWLHGSIAWRQNYLRTLQGTAIEDTPIDRQVARIKLAGLAILIAAIAVQMIR